MFFITPGIDDGDIIGMRVFDINEWDTCRSVYYKTALSQAEIVSQIFSFNWERYRPKISANW
jgi:methionyl-tRNA formyltransferase